MASRYSDINETVSRRPHNLKILLYFLMILFPSILSAQQAFDVLIAEGTVKVQRSQKRVWEKVQIGNKINDNDLVETFFQTRLIMQFGNKNIIIIGSNSKALVNIVQGEKPGTTNVNLTLFAGGLFVKAIADCHVNIYTANAVSEIDTGSISAVAESKSGETGFQLLSGTSFIRNIAQQNGRTLRAGLTTMILPNKEPTAPLYITYRHVAVLKHFFGDEYINSELEASGIKPTDDQGGQSTLSKTFATKGAEYKDEGMHKTLFSINRIFGSIIRDQELNDAFYQPILFPDSLFTNKSQLSFKSGFGFASTGAKTRYTLGITHRMRYLDVGARLNFAQNYTSAMQTDFSSLAGILDIIDHLTIGRKADSLYLSLGGIDNFSLGYGLIVNQYSNYSRNVIYKPLGVSTGVRLGVLSLKGFLSDITLPITGGIYLGLEPTSYHFGFGYYFDADQYRQGNKSQSFRFSKQTESDLVYSNTKANISNAHIYNINFSAKLFSHEDLSLLLRFEFAQKLLNGNDGFVVRMPGFDANSSKFSFGGGLVFQQGRLLSSMMSNHYQENRFHIKNGETEFDADTIITSVSQLSKNRRANGFDMYLKTNPYRGIDVKFSWQQDVTNKHSLVVSDTSDTTKGRNAPGDFSLGLSIRVNDSLTKYVKYGEIYITQNHGVILPAGGGFFRSWDFEAGFYALSVPLIFNMAFELGGALFYFDSGTRLNNVVEPTDFIFELTAGLRWGF